MASSGDSRFFGGSKPLVKRRTASWSATDAQTGERLPLLDEEQRVVDEGQKVVNDERSTELTCQATSGARSNIRAWRG